MPPGAAIINTASVQGFSPSEGLLDYATTKAGILAFTKALAKQQIERGIRVNAVAPGPFWTALQPSGGQTQEKLQTVRRRQPARPARPAGGTRARLRLPGLAGGQLRHGRDLCGDGRQGHGLSVPAPTIGAEPGLSRSRSAAVRLRATRSGRGTPCNQGRPRPIADFTQAARDAALARRRELAAQPKDPLGTLGLFIVRGADARPISAGNSGASAPSWWSGARAATAPPRRPGRPARPRCGARSGAERRRALTACPPGASPCTLRPRRGTPAGGRHAAWRPPRDTRGRTTMHILVIGAAGMVGRKLVARLAHGRRARRAGRSTP